MATLRFVRSFAMSLPEVSEQPHHGFPSFRVSDKIFATLPDALHLHIMLDEPEVQLAVAAEPAAIAELWWGKRLAGVRVIIAAAGEALVADLLTQAWRRRAPRRVLLPSTPKASSPRKVRH